MGRAFLGVIIGYLSMALVVFSALTIAFLTMGPERAFRSGSYQVTETWLIVWFLVSLVAAVLGGLVCALIAKGKTSKAPIVLAAIVLILGGLTAILELRPHEDSRPTERQGAVGNLDAMTNARQPAVVAIATPLIGALGIFVGAKLRRGPTS